MKNTPRFVCGIWSFAHLRRFAILGSELLLIGMWLSACGGADSSQSTASTAVMAPSFAKDSPSPRTVSQQGPASGNIKSALPTSNNSGTISPEKSARLAKLGSLSLLSVLSERERAGLLEQLPDASPSERLTAINGYPKLAEMTEQQKQVLLNQLETIVPINIPENRVVCSCSNDIKREFCSRERCSNKLEIESLCIRACGTLSSFKSECFASNKCERK
jgi:hypothetical protein